MNGRCYIAIDLKSFYASVECVDRGLNPLETNLVVADSSRTEKTICLAVTPSLKAYGISGRARLFEVVQRVSEINAKRRRKALGRRLTGSSVNNRELSANPNLALGYITAPPRMRRYMEVSSRVYEVYLKYVSPEDIHVYSIDEVFIDVTDYLGMYKITARELAAVIVRDVLDTTGITATVGIGTNLYLCKVAMDIVAKHIGADKYGVRIAELDERSYRKTLWEHRPLTDFWRVGRGTAERLERCGILTMGDIALCSVKNEELLYKMFGVNAQLLIDHAWGFESCTIADIKAYVPESTSLSTGQVLPEPYDFDKGELIVREMADSLSLDLVRKGLETDRLVLSVGYDAENLSKYGRCADYTGEVCVDFYGRAIPKPARGTARLGLKTSSAKMLIKAAAELYDSIVMRDLTIRRVTLAACGVTSENDIHEPEQLTLFTDMNAAERRDRELSREKDLSRALLRIKDKYGKNAILKGMDLEEGATAVSRNTQVGGHKA